MTPEELKQRTKKFALRILKLVSALPSNVQGRTVGGQLVRAGTSVGANYVLLVAVAQGLNLLPSLALSKRRRTKARSGWN